jgi:hypothetical protein
MMIDLDGAQRFGFEESVEDKAADEHVDIINFKKVLPYLGRPGSVFFVKNVEMDAGLINTFHMLPSDHELEMLVMVPVAGTVESLVEVTDVLLYLGGRRLVQAMSKSLKSKE